MGRGVNAGSEQLGRRKRFSGGFMGQRVKINWMGQIYDCAKFSRGRRIGMALRKEEKREGQHITYD
jgi:hypothetical protein